MWRTLFLLLLTLNFSGFAQDTDSLFTRKPIKSTQIDLLFSYYGQDGKHSAVTGGDGTEELQVYLNKLVVTQRLDSSNTIVFEGGIDIISSASTDNIDYKVSSASSQDNRLWASAGYNHYNTLSKTHTAVNGYFSMESDYLSIGLGGSWNGQNENGNWRYGISGQFFADDLRWGRLNEDYRRPVTLVYPVELRDSVWFDIYNRYSFNISFDIQHDINRRMNIGFFPGLIYQEGLLSTPFHRFYFVGEEDAVVENLPQQRIKIPLGVQLNSFIGNRLILQAYYRFYWDDFGISAHTINFELPIKVSPQFSLTPFCRFYAQSAAKYFYPYQQALAGEQYFTSDYDLSDFTSYKLGLGSRLLFVRGNFFRQLSIRYSYYNRQDGLYYNQISTYLQMKTN